ncbi:MAG: hypothetical protein ACYC61_12070 [Isosphaeraceae bacterium]
MNHYMPVPDAASGASAALRLYLHSRPESEGIFWKINGFRATLLVWTREEWNRLESRPQDAQLHPSGVWCALRLD